jgi:hypothetical protein
MASQPESQSASQAQQSIGTGASQWASQIDEVVGGEQ